jgi:hypothetical protein
MRWRGTLSAAGLAALLVTGTAIAAGAADPAQNVKDDGGRIDPPTSGGFCDEGDAVRTIRPDKGPFFGIRVNSMDVRAEAKRVACLEYACDGLLPGDGSKRYQLVRNVWRGGVAPNESCDEVLAAPLPAGAEVRYETFIRTTRWVRDVGPDGETPVGGFVGEMRIDAARGAGDATIRLPLVALRLIGTQGLRPGRGDPTDALAGSDKRCGAPLHEEGFYQGGFDRRGLAFLARLAQEQGGSVEPFRTLAGARIVGTFEGQLTLDPTADVRPYRFCNLASGVWWFDGLLGWRCRDVVVADPAADR